MLEFLKTGTRTKKDTFSASRKGSGFFLLSTHKKVKRNLPWPQIMVAAALIGAGLLAFALIAGRDASGAFMLLAGAFISMSALILYDLYSRRRWEKNIVAHLEELTARHDRLVREVARSRSDVAVIKEGLGKTAQEAEKQAARLPPSHGPEAKMIETLVHYLGAMGQAPRAPVNEPAQREILEMQMAPPPPRPEILSEIDDAIGGQDFTRYSDTVLTELIQHAVRNDQIDIFMQPVVMLPQRKIRMMEVFARIRAGAGSYLPAQRYLPLAHREQLVPAIDNLLLLRCLHILENARDGGAQGVCYILNVTPATLNDRSFMGDLVSFLSKNRKMAARLVFELPQGEFDLMDKTLIPVLDGLSQLGCRFSIDRVRSRMIDIDILKSRHIRFIKLDAQWLLKEGESKTGFNRIVRLKKQLDAAGIDLIVEKIEDEKTLRELLDYGIDFGQGYLFGKPDHQIAYQGGGLAANVA